MKDLYAENYKTLKKQSELLTHRGGQGLGAEARASVLAGRESEEKVYSC